MKTRDANELLTKIRKGATAGFNVQDWLCVIDAIGWIWTKNKGKEGNEYDITRPATGSSFYLKKEPGYRVIVFYDFLKWAKDQGLMEAIDAKLGPAPVKAPRRDMTNTGTCACCFGNFKLRPRLEVQAMVLHGYERPGYGYTIGRCFGTMFQPYELSVDGTVFMVKQVETAREATVARLEVLRAEPAELLKKNHFSAGFATIKKGEPEYAYQLASKVAEVEYELRGIERDLAFFKKKVTEWKLQPLPGEKLCA